MSAEFDLSFLLQAVKGQNKSPSGPTHFRGVQTDSRQPQKESLFVPLKGDKHDAHAFVAQAVENGAAGVLVHEWRPEFTALSVKATFIQVSDTLKALQDLAHAWRKHADFKVIGVTGSNGKTSTKEILAQLLTPHFKIYASPGSFNNHWGVPISLLSAGKDTQVVVQEMGMNHKGEIQRLCEIAVPDVVMVTMVGTAHMGELGSQSAIREAKNEIYRFSPQAKRIYNLDNDQTLILYQEALSQESEKALSAITFSSHNSKARVRMRAQRFSAAGLEISGVIDGVEGNARVNIFGRHNVVNLMAASAGALALGVAPAQIFIGLSQLNFSSWGRNQWISTPGGPRILFDGYNANPESMTALLKNIFELEMEGKKAFVFGDMRELGAESEKAHQAVASLAAQVGLGVIWYMGEHVKAVENTLRSSDFNGQLFLSSDFDAALATQVWETLAAGDMVALKASRGSRIERVLQSWGVDGF